MQLAKNSQITVCRSLIQTRIIGPFSGSSVYLNPLHFPVDTVAGAQTPPWRMGFFERHTVTILSRGYAVRYIPSSSVSNVYPSTSACAPITNSAVGPSFKKASTLANANAPLPNA